jgi:hypothetical protein
LLIQYESTDVAHATAVLGALQGRSEGKERVAHTRSGRSTEEIGVNGMYGVLTKGGDRAILPH